MERRIASESYPDSAPTRHQAAAVIIWARAERHHSEPLAITPVNIEGRYWGEATVGDMRGGPILIF